ncbi:MAG: adenosylcobinamide-GDP ribazoletransferase, partial [Nitrospirae bacterium]
MQSLTRSLCWAWHFLTIIPIPFIGQVEPSSRELARSMRWYPVVGYVLGSGLALLDRGFAAVVPPEARALLIVAALVVVTGGLHQDGLADTVDGLAKRGTPEERLGAMRDSRIGALGATALVLTLGLRYTGLLALVPSDWPFVLVCMPAIGRWSMVIGAYGVPYARSQGG